VNKERLLNVARALRESEHPERFTMLTIAHPCGTPACALGHYAARRDLQDVFSLSRNGFLVTKSKALPFEVEREHFGITEEQEDELFGARGCDNAPTAVAAAEYIERFVERHG
jgi:hypothetical protein